MSVTKLYGTSVKIIFSKFLTLSLSMFTFSPIYRRALYRLVYSRMKLFFLLDFIRITFLEISKRTNLFWAISSLSTILLIYKPIIRARVEYGCVCSLIPAPKQTSRNLNYFKTLASELPFVHSILLPSKSPCRDLYLFLSYRIQKLSS